jgi:Ca-activated chloride channel family protein
MKKIFDRHAEVLTPAERQGIWRAITGTRAPESRVRLLRALATATAAVAATVITVAVVNREPAVPRRPIAVAPPASAPHVIAPQVEIVVPKAHPLSLRRDPALALAESLARVAAVRDAARPLPSPTVAARGGPTGGGSTGDVTGTVTEHGKTPIEFANVIILGTRLGTMTDANGNFVITGVPVGAAQVQIQPLGYDKQVQAVQVNPGATTTLAFDVGESRVVKQIEEIQVGVPRRIDTKSSATVQSIIPMDNLREGARGGVVAQGGELHFRGGRGGEVKFEIGHSPPVPAAGTPPVVPTTGGSALPNDEPYDSMFFRNYGVNPFITTDEDSLSTFAVDVDAGSYTIARRYLELGHLPPADAVRTEEFVNFFPQGYPKFENDDFRILVDGAPSPFGRGYQLLRIGIKGREIRDRDRKPAQLIFVIDVSGSMEREDRLGLVKQALRLLVDRLRDDDRIGIVVFGTNARVLLEPVALGESAVLVAGVYRKPGDEEKGERRSGRRSILEAIDLLQAEGSTNTEEGLLFGYDMARRAFRSNAINRIVLCADGVANEGHTGPQSILDRVRSEADRGIHLSTIGFGMGNYNDVLMEQLADKGDGNYYYVDELREARRVLVENLTGTLQVIAKDAKIQVEFDPTRVLRYRLLGFENRDVADRDFRNDKVDAGEIGAGHEVTALYEVKLAPGAGRGTMATVRLRYARPEHDGGAPEVREIAKEFDPVGLARRFEDSSPQFRLDAAVAEFAEILRRSYWAKESRFSDVLPVARSAARDLRTEVSAELVSLIEKAARLSNPPAQPEEER